MTTRRVVSAVFATLLTWPVFTLALNGTAYADSPGRSACKTIDRLDLLRRQTYSKKQHQAVASAARSLQRSSEHGAKRHAAKLSRAKSDADRKDRIHAAWRWCLTNDLTPGQTTATTQPATPELAMAALEGSFNAVQQQAADALRTDSLVEAVRDFSYDTAANTINLDILSTFQSSPDYARSLYDQQAWEITSAFAPFFWQQEFIDTINEIPGGSEALLPAFHMRMEDVLEYRCSADAMKAFAAKTAGMQDFLAQCVV